MVGVVHVVLSDHPIDPDPPDRELQAQMTLAATKIMHYGVGRQAQALAEPGSAFSGVRGVASMSMPRRRSLSV